MPESKSGALPLGDAPIISPFMATYAYASLGRQDCSAHPCAAPLRGQSLRDCLVSLPTKPFEPGNAGIKIRCLTAWRRPKNPGARYEVKGAKKDRPTAPYLL